MKLKNYFLTTFFFLMLLIQSCASTEDVPLSPENTISSFTIAKGEVSKEFAISAETISGKVESNFELNDLTLKVSIPKGATISPDPATIKSITVPFNLTVTAENGDKKVYNVAINREPSIENSVLEFNVTNQNFATTANINIEKGEITRRLPEFTDLKNLSIDVKVSKYATISPDPKSIKDYSVPVNFTVKSESGIEKVYQVKFEYMDVERIRSCSEPNAWKWFGGDNRKNVPDLLPYDRNVGTGQTIMVDKDLVPSVFNIELGQGFNEGFYYDDTNTPYNKPVTLKLIIRDENSNILVTTTTTVSADFSGGLVPFDLGKLNLLLLANKKYYFFWYLVNGETLGVSIASPGNKNNDGSGFCFNSGWTGESKISEKTTLEDLSSWNTHKWHFNIELDGKE